MDIMITCMVVGCFLLLLSVAAVVFCLMKCQKDIDILLSVQVEHQKYLDKCLTWDDPMDCEGNRLRKFDRTTT